MRDKELTKEFILKKVKEVSDYVVKTKHAIHENPELSGLETQTIKLIIAEIEKLNIPFEMVAENSLIATLKGTAKGKGKNIVLRADIDALPMPEDINNLKHPKKSVSKVDGVCHGCGHDAHTAMLLGTMKILHSLKDKFAGTVFFCFEQAEETGAGIMPMMKGLASKQVDGVWAIHVYAGLEAGKISVEAGPRMAGSAAIDIRIHGKSGHGSRPDLAINPIFAAANLLTTLSSEWVNGIDSTKTVTLGIGSVQAGTVGNIIPDYADIKGTIRFYDEEEGEKAKELIKRVATAIATAHRCTVSFGEKMGFGAFPTVNDNEMARCAQKSLSEVLPVGSVSGCQKWFASESMCLYLKKYRGVLAFLGIKDDEFGSGAEHHNGKFDLPDYVLDLGVASTVTYALDFMGQ